MLQNNNTNLGGQVLCVGGWDPSGLAGLAVDSRALHSLGIQALMLVSCNTWQNTSHWGGLKKTEIKVLDNNLQALKSEFQWQACKVGMLVDVEQVEWLTYQWKKNTLPLMVYDPVLGASAGGHTLKYDMKNAIINTLLPHVHLLTPNLIELAYFTDCEVKEVSDMEFAAKKMIQMGVKNIFIKGGHLDKDIKVDYFYNGETGFYLESQYSGPGARGTGCALASLIAGELARGVLLDDAVRLAHTGVQIALAKASQVGCFDARYLNF